ncbi:MAG: hypothetical protein ABJ081_09560 [Hyphomicrobiales bacterium]
MKIITHYFLTFTIIFFTTYSSSASENIDGIYKGQIWSNGNYPGKTVFSVSLDGKISGHYEFKGVNEIETGKLDSCNLVKQTLSCIWTDLYGSGDFRVKFSQDFRTFSGKWFDEVGDFKKYGERVGHHWNGKKL